MLLIMSAVLLNHAHASAYKLENVSSQALCASSFCNKLDKQPDCQKVGHAHAQTANKYRKHYP